MLTLRQLESFYLVATHGGFSPAAGTPPLNLTRASLYSQVATLQRELGTPLYRIQGKRIKLTEAGRKLHNALDSLLVSLRSLPTLISEKRTAEVSAAFTPVTIHFVTPILASYRSHYPQVHIAVIERLTTEIWDLMARGSVDFAIGPPPYPPNAHIAFRRVCEDPPAVLVPRDHKLANVPSLTIEALAREPLITLVRGTVQRQNTESAFAAKGYTPQFVAEVSSPNLIAQFAALGLGVGLTSQLGIDDDTRVCMAVIPATHLFSAAEIAILTHRSRYLSEAVTDLINNIVRHIEHRFSRIVERADRHRHMAHHERLRMGGKARL